MGESDPADPRELAKKMRQNGFFQTEDFASIPPLANAEEEREPIGPGSMVGRFRVVSTLGEGGMGAVFRAFDPELDRDVALKVLHGLSAEPRRLERFRREGQITASLQHPGIVRVHGTGEIQGSLFLAYELVEGQTLDELLRERELRGRLELVLELSRAIAFAHEHGVIHRDLKPENVLVDREGRVRVADFGLATARGLQRITQTGALLGTPLYMPPEQFLSKQDLVGPASDVWAIGVILHEALTGQRPFEAENLIELGARIQRGLRELPSDLCSEVSPGLDHVCATALQPDLGDRYADAGQLADALDAALQGTLSPPILTQRRAVAALAFSLGLIGMLLAALVFVQLSDPPRPPKPVRLSADVVTANVFSESLELPIRVSGDLPDQARLRLTVGGKTSWADPGADSVLLTLERGENPVSLQVTQGGDPVGAPWRASIHRWEGPAWIHQLPPDRWPPMPLPDGIEFGEGRGEYVNEHEGSIMVWVPPGTFTAGRDASAPGIKLTSWMRPSSQVRLSEGYFLGKYEVTWSRLRRFCRTTGRILPTFEERMVEHPARVTWLQAIDYCAWAGARLPSEAEWARAARGSDGRLFPWGDELPGPAQANLKGSRFEGTCAVDALLADRSPFGCIGMAGNAREWAYDWFGHYPAAPRVDPQGPSLDQPTWLITVKDKPRNHPTRVVRGGDYTSAPESASTFERRGRKPDHDLETKNIRPGFRICRSPRPSAPRTPPMEWEVTIFPFDLERVDPRVDDAAWRQLAEGADRVLLVVPNLLLDFSIDAWRRKPKIAKAVQRIPEDYFGTLARTRVKLAAGSWELATISDDGVRVWVDDELVIDNWTYHGGQVDQAIIDLPKPRTVRLRVEHFELSGFSRLHFYLVPRRRPGS